MHVADFDSPSNNQKDDVHSFCRVQIVALVANKAFILLLTEYFDFVGIFSLQLFSKLHEYIRINDHNIELINK